MTCPHCQENSMTTDNGVDFYCMLGCRKCNLCDRQAAPDSEGCPTCDLEGLIYEAEMAARKAVAA